MNPETPRTPREESELRLTALLMGELPPEEAAAIQAQMAADPELAALHGRLRKALELLREASALPEQSAPPASARLSAERRERLLAHFKTPAPAAPSAPAPIARMPRRNWSWAVPLGIAAAGIALLGTGLLMPLLSPKRAEHLRTEESTVRALPLNGASRLNDYANAYWLHPQPTSALVKGGSGTWLYAPASPGFTTANPSGSAANSNLVFHGGAMEFPGSGDGGRLAGTQTLQGEFHQGQPLSLLPGGGLVVNGTTSPIGNGYAGGTIQGIGGEQAGAIPEDQKQPFAYDLNGGTQSLGTLAGMNTYSGATTVSSETLTLSGASTNTGSVLATGGVPVVSGAKPAGAFDTGVSSPPAAGNLIDAYSGVTNFASSLPSTPPTSTTGAISGAGTISSGANTLVSVGGTLGITAQRPSAGFANGTGILSLNSVQGNTLNVAPPQTAADATSTLKLDSGGLISGNDKNQPSVNTAYTGVITGRITINGGITQTVPGANALPPNVTLSSSIAAAGGRDRGADKDRDGFPNEQPWSKMAVRERESDAAAKHAPESIEKDQSASAPPATPSAPGTSNLAPVGLVLAPLFPGTPEEPTASANIAPTPPPPGIPAPSPALSGESKQTSQTGSSRKLALPVSDTATPPAPPAPTPYVSAKTRLDESQLAKLESSKTDSLKKALPEEETLVEWKRRDLSKDAAVSAASGTAGLFVGQRVTGANIPASPAQPKAHAPAPQPEVLTRTNPFSTFSLNITDVSFKLAAASLEQGRMPEPSSVRSEEFVNAFDYRDPEPAPGAPLAFASERARYPFAQNRDLLRFSVKTAAAGRQPGRPLNIVLLLDKSGSMERADRVNIVREALRVLTAQLQPQDKLSIVTFARTPRLWADGVAGDKAGAMIARVGEITPEGGTNLDAALDLGYATALRHYDAGGISRVVLFTDGAANLGDVDPAALKKKVEAHRKQGVALDCFGIGWEGYNDDLLEQLTRNGDGRYGFINSPEEAASNFASQLAGALRVAASDVKVQVEFNPRRVTAYRQIGYAKHQLTKEQFRDNTVNAAQIGAAESGNALYVVEVDPRGEGDLATVRVRFREPGTSDYREHEWTVPFTGNAQPLEQASPALRLAGTAGAFSEMLAASPYAAEVTDDRLIRLLDGVPQTYGADPRPRKLEWMIRQARSLTGR